MAEYKDVKNQKHYTEQTVQPIEYMELTMTSEQYEGWLLGNVIKYVSRYRHKNGLEDLRKAEVYMGWLVDHVSDNENTEDAFDSDDETFASDALAMSRDYYNEKVKDAKQDYYHIYPDWEAAMNRQKKVTDRLKEDD